MLSACGGHVGSFAPPATAPGTSLAPAQMRYAGSDVPPRFQWNANFGYCGEVSIVSAGLYYGQYVSQYVARATASPGVPQYRAKSQLLLGVNDAYAARAMHLDAVEWNTAAETSTDAFLAWVKQNVVRGRPVAIGVYTNEYLFYGRTNPKAGDPDYDHIVPVTNVGTTHAVNDPAYHADDVLVFSDNGIWGPPSNPPYVYRYSFGAFQKTRAQANAPSGTIYALANDAQNYGIAITGVTDPAHETLPVRLSTNVNYERPAMRNGSDARPAPMPLILTVTVSNLKPGASYRLYRYDDVASVPDTQFNANAGNASGHWTIRAAAGRSTFTMSQRIMSDQVAVYRAVPASAP